MKLKGRYLLVLAAYLCSTFLSAQEKQPSSQLFRIAFYNCENYFDSVNDTASVGDDEYIPTGGRHWSSKRYASKRNNLYKAILGIGEGAPPDIIGFSEVENLDVLENLAYNTPLKKIGLEIIHKDSPDPRGIDIALFYRKSSFRPIQYDYIPMETSAHAREILYVEGVANGSDTIHLFVNHWPSRIRLQEAERQRVAIAKLLLNKIRMIRAHSFFAKIVLMGDFNDEPTDRSLCVIGKKDEIRDTTDRLVNLSYSWRNEETGTLKHNGMWQIFDQILVTPACLHDCGLIVAHAHIVRLPFLLEKDTRFLGSRPHRTFYGFKYTNGFSDHLPVVLELKRSQ
ncbi:MAG: endonuclease/exonuclease/phosphatase family protein [Bacteroidota bacterium]|nr:endonuclease/exonuclease/phosphatase family protein [Bacteroidota bacterium]